MNKIKVENLSFSYTPNDLVLSNINITFDNRTTAIIGQNGAGKTTLVKLLKGLIKPISGDIQINGTSISSQSVASLAKQIGLVFQNPDDQIFKQTVLDEVMFGPLNIGINEVEAKNAAIEALSLVGMSKHENSNPYDLGLSERKLIAIASILSMNTPIIIFDEPTIAQDFISKEKIKNIIRYLQFQGKLVLTIIHDMDFVAECFERTIVLCKGSVLIDDETKKVFQNVDLLKEAHLELPHVARLSKELALKNLSLTIDDFITDWFNY
ncbi:energy-coupling factor ABC transporter ATP-binding protein [Anaeromicropila herbilytica]|uniref:ABC transporter ATP-binding protein n=1 Tax=Anaeromicropila herbilytica TaxID=2785025 RepID=A0A7R7EP90_9FIRM|nr:ATP-binding cassette domain-containing protein [Anaeromicropila herbilytica]BCN32484.1 ABC transporter ATP-binding protein [Anaeromicropila herbilytica]